MNPEFFTHYPWNAVAWCLCVAVVVFVVSGVLKLRNIWRDHPNRWKRSA